MWDSLGVIRAGSILKKGVQSPQSTFNLDRHKFPRLLSCQCAAFSIYNFTERARFHYERKEGRAMLNWVTLEARKGRMRGECCHSFFYVTRECGTWTLGG